MLPPDAALLLMMSAVLCIACTPHPEPPEAALRASLASTRAIIRQAGAMPPPQTGANATASPDVRTAAPAETPTPAPGDAEAQNLPDLPPETHAGRDARKVGPQGERPRSAERMAPGDITPTSTRLLMGATPDRLRHWLGEPELRRVEGDAEIWLYRGDACLLDIILYPEGRRLEVAQASARSNGATTQTEAGCLATIGAPGVTAGKTESY